MGKVELIISCSVDDNQTDRSYQRDGIISDDSLGIFCLLSDPIEEDEQSRYLQLSS
jgi:hypothetical protein